MENKTVTFERFWVQLILRCGLGLAVILMAAGAVMKNAAGALDTPGVSLKDLFNGDIFLGDRLMGWGVLVLAVTPALRVISLLFLWIKQKDWKYVGISAVVLVILSISFFIGNSSH